MIKLQNIIEGVQDKGIFKAVFLAGGPGSGKTMSARWIFGIPDKFNISMSGMKMVNSDKDLKHLLKKFGFGTDLDKMPDELFSHLTGMSKDMVSPPQDVDSGLRKYAKELTAARMKLYKQGKIGMIIDGTGHDFQKLHSMKNELEADGYDTYMVLVNTSLEVAQKRNQQRDRILPPALLKKSWSDVQKNIGAFQNLFKQNFVIVDNSKHLSDKEAEAKFVPLVTKVVRKFANMPIKNPLGRKWVEKQQILNKRR
ncbi:hypothetical protein HOE22_09710 [Candidatus Woesearchaeota archaeon]|jgi:predicted kinase|nr:hypothetical protein [Candidatus Woesearchaeota archaeon]MBT7558336.1 hypothetical protein [Candidatus Woesearchaeota archaeon]